MPAFAPASRIMREALPRIYALGARAYRTLKLRALCWILRWMRAGQRGGWLARPN
jgi:hypothetical protein